MSDPIFTPDEIVSSRVDVEEQRRRVDEQEKLTRVRIEPGVVFVKTDPDHKVETSYPDRAEPYPGAAGPDPIVWAKPKKKRRKRTNDFQRQYALGMFNGLSVAMDITAERIIDTCDRAMESDFAWAEVVLELARARAEIKKSHDIWRKKAGS